ncbi:portal vertex protein [uncultured Caudovirales phage]|uniref:Portal protein n=1 Tax=uncultured Caudovirales phage TaxID=2100421 RepID=A0A6J5KPR9_9CAUD|nr:portal vertex protein [uncultured Caudovirales phage]
MPSSPITPQLEDGAINIQTGAHYGIYVDLDGSYRTEVDLITKYRTMAMQPEIESAIEDIVNEAIVHDTRGETIKIVLDGLDQPDKIKNMIRKEFKEISRLLDFGNFGSDIFRRWYVDGRLYYNVVINPDAPREGIQQLIFIDPRRIRKIRNISKKKKDGVEVVDRIDTFYLYNEKTVNNNVQSPQLLGSYAGGTKISEDSVIHLTSGLFDPGKSTVLSYIHKAIRPMNQLRFVEDATVIYRVSRAPERRVFYVDVGNMPKMKAEQYLKDIMTKFRNKLTYDSATGEVRDERKHMSMLEDFWMPRRGEGKSTEITTLPAGQNLGQMDDVFYFEKKLYKALNVPISRLEASTGFSLGRSNEITRDELKFDKFVDKLRARFSILFDELLARQLALKGVCTLDEWNIFKQSIHYDYIKDNNFTELKEAELLQNRVNTLNTVQPYVGQYYSKRWVQENILNLNEEEIVKMQKEMDVEAKDEEKNLMDQQKRQAASQPQPDTSANEPKDSQDINTKVSQLFTEK